MQTSILSLATSIPATTRSFCAIIQLPFLLGSGSKPMQLSGLRKAPDLSHAPRQALVAFEHERAQIQRRAVGENRPFAHSGRFCRHKSTNISRKPLRREGRTFRSNLWFLTRVLSSLHTRPRVRSGIRSSLRPLFSRVTSMQDSGESGRENAGAWLQLFDILNRRMR